MTTAATAPKTIKLELTEQEAALVLGSLAIAARAPGVDADNQPTLKIIRQRLHDAMEQAFFVAWWDRK